MRLVLVVLVLAVAGVGSAAVAGVFDGARPSVATVPNKAFPPADEPDAAARVWAVGDGEASPGGKALGARIAAAEPDRFLYLGDVYERGSARDFRRRYAPAYGRLRRITAPTPGNHDWGAHRRGYDPYWRKATGARTPPWYAFRLGGWQLVSLNSEAPHDRGSPQVAWLRRELRRGAGTCRLAVWHRPFESAGLHRDNGDVRPFHDALRGHATIVLNGHDHDSQRLRPRGGIHGYVAGAGGRDLYPVDRSDERLRFADDTHFAALRITLEPGRARLAFVTPDGTVLDRSTVRCER